MWNFVWDHKYTLLKKPGKFKAVDICASTNYILKCITKLCY